MNFFNQIYDKLFSKNKEQVLSKEVLERTEREQLEYHEWTESDPAKYLLNRIKRAYYFKKTNIKDEIIIDILNTPYAKGMAVSNLPDADKKTYQLLMDHFKTRVLEQGYRQSGSNRKVQNKPNWVETSERYYLKPPIQTEIPINQYYGNVHLELVLHDDRPHIFKLQANVYSDSLYEDAYDFEDLVAKIFE